MANRKRKEGSKKPAATPVRKKAAAKASGAKLSRKAAAGPSRKPNSRSSAAVAPAARNRSSVERTPDTADRSDYASAGLNALRERLKRAAKAPGKRASSESAKADARVDAVLQRLSDSYRRILD